MRRQSDRTQRVVPPLSHDSMHDEAIISTMPAVLIAFAHTHAKVADPHSDVQAGRSVRDRQQVYVLQSTAVRVAAC